MHYVYVPLDKMSKNAEVAVLSNSFMYCNSYQERFRELFAVKQKYSEDELAPYFEDVVGSRGQAKSLTELLMSHTRHVDGFYFAK